MNKIFKKILLVISIVLLLGAFSCAQGGVSQADYDNLKNKLSQTESQLKTLQDKVSNTALSANLSALSNEDLKKQSELYAAQIVTLDTQKKAAEASLQDLNTKYTVLDAQKKAADASLQDLSAKYADLQKQYQALATPPEPITEEAVEQAIFALINQERESNNVPELSWGKNLYNIAKPNSQSMADTGQYQTAKVNFFQQIFVAAAYGSADGIAKGALEVWKINQYQFEHGIISKAFTYCAVGAVKQGDAIFITWMAANNE